MPASCSLAALLIALSIAPAGAQQAIVVQTPRVSLRRADSISVAGALVRRAAGATPATIVFSQLQEERMLTWTERPAAQ